MECYPSGMPDELFMRGDVPMTKAEVRAITMSKARLRPGMRVLDIGAGTGSLTVEAALLCPGGEVLAVERDPEAVDLLRQILSISAWRMLRSSRARHPTCSAASNRATASCWVARAGAWVTCWTPCRAT
ncbi:MAG: methyltransferase domain-containing protein [Armatimonadota bacterium]